MWVQAVWYDVFSFAVFLPYFSMLILSLPLLGLGSKSTSLSPGFCVCRPRQYDTICWELNLISGFFAFFWLIVWADGINKCGWCLPGGRGCWLKGPHPIPSLNVPQNLPKILTFFCQGVLSFQTLSLGVTTSYVTPVHQILSCGKAEC